MSEWSEAASSRLRLAEGIATDEPDPLMRELLLSIVSIERGRLRDAVVEDVAAAAVDVAGGRDRAIAMLQCNDGSPEMAHPGRRVRGGGAGVDAPQGASGRASAGGDDRGDQRRDAADDDAPRGDRRAR